MINLNGHLRILLIEDNKDDEELIRIALGREGKKAALRRVETEGETLLAIDSETWDVILCDYLLPNFSGERALSLIREKLGDIPFIFISGFEDEETALRLLKLGAHDFLYKSNLSRLPIAVRREIIQARDRMSGRLEVERSYLLTLEAFGAALEIRDVYTSDHTTRVTDLALRLARALRVSSSQFKNIHHGALLHDIGKIRLPDSVLLKPEPLTPEEWSIMRLHPVIAHDMLSHIEFLEGAINIPYCHHEKFDGSGYPRGLEGEEIPLEARIFSIVDVYDALTHDRPYRKSWTKEQAIEYLREERGRSFDPEIVDKFIEVIK